MDQLLEKVLATPDLNTSRSVAGNVRTRYLAAPGATLAELAKWTEHNEKQVRITAGLALGTVTVRNAPALPEVMPYVERLANDRHADVRRIGAAGALELIWLYHYDEIWLVVEDWVERKNDLVRRVALDTMASIVRSSSINKPSMLKNFLDRGLNIMDRLLRTGQPDLRATIASTVNDFALKAPDLVVPWVKDWSQRSDLNSTSLAKELLDLSAGKRLRGINREEILARVSSLEEELVQRISGWLRTGKGRMQYFTIIVDSVLNLAESDSAPYAFWADPYRGCQFRCEFCATRSLSEFAGEKEEDFVRRLVVLANAAEVMTREIQTSELTDPASRVIRVGMHSDPYQAAEEKFQITREMLKVFLETGTPAVIQTRSEMVLRDLDLLEKLGEKGLVNVLITLPTPIEGVRKKLETGVSSVTARLRTINMLANKGIPTGLVISPVVPFLTDHPEALEEVIRRGAESGAAFVIPEVLQMTGTAGPKMRFFLQSFIPALVEKYEELYPAGDPAGQATEEYRTRICSEIVPPLAEKYGANRTGLMLSRLAPAGQPG